MMQREFGYIKLIFFLWLLAPATGCHQHSRPYQNNLGIAPAVVAALDTAGYTRISWTDTTRDFGSIAEGAKLYIRFGFRNSGRRPLFITSVEASCGCTVADYPSEAIMPGDTGSVTAAFDSRYHPGTTRKSVTVTSNSVNRPRQVLLFTGLVKKDSLVQR